jgi:hippurate hydrolase
MLRRVALLVILATPLLMSASPRQGPQANPVAPGTVKKFGAAVDAKIAAELPNLVKLYQHLHSHPELSTLEVQSAARMAEELRKLGFDVTEKIGGTGVVAVMKNGPGKTVLVRADMDALPVKEQTGLPYASTVRMNDRKGVDCPVMHACGHDIHMTCLIGTARTLASLKDKWSGTLILIAQPAEEIGAGAMAMLDDGLFKRFPKPDVCLALHADAQEKVGTIRYTEGLAMANVDSVDVTVKGVGGHGASPHSTVDPIVLSARIILDLQTIASREVKPTDPVVVTVGSIHGGTKHNIIPNEVKLQITVRTFKDSVRDHVLKAIERICKAAAAGARAPEPEIKVDLKEYTPAMLNDPALTKETMNLFREFLGTENVQVRDPVMGGEDFGQYGRQGIPICMFFLGSIDEDRYAQSLKDPKKPLPSMHSDSYAPVGEPSIKVGVKALSLAALNQLSAK